jgi:hypothetical protein
MLWKYLRGPLHIKIDQSWLGSLKNLISVDFAFFFSNSEFA